MKTASSYLFGHQAAAKESHQVYVDPVSLPRYQEGRLEQLSYLNMGHGVSEPKGLLGSCGQS